MDKYTFLVKPAFFIFNLIFAAWMVFAIEHVKPSDFGRFSSFFDYPKPETIQDKLILKKLCYDFKAGTLDSVMLDRKLEAFLKGRAQMPKKSRRAE